MHKDESGRLAKAAWLIAAVTLVLFGGVAVMWIIGWQVTPWSLEGAWIYPLAVGLLLAAAYSAGRVRARAGWVVAALTLSLFSILVALWAFTWGFPPPSFEGWVLYLITAVVLVAALLAAYTAASAERETHFGLLRDSPPMSIATRSARVTSGVLVGLALLIALVLREPLYDAFALRAEFNLVGLSALFAWSAFVFAALFSVIRARKVDPTFRGIYSEIVRLIAVLQACVAIAMWFTVTISGAYTGRDSVQEVEHCERQGGVTRCSLRLDK